MHVHARVQIPLHLLMRLGSMRDVMRPIRSRRSPATRAASRPVDQGTVIVLVSAGALMAFAIGTAMLRQPALSALAGSGGISLVGRVAGRVLPRRRRR
ncbi:hypothetical protein AB0M46_19065 [Dactylosporangium sp. NPDC051485]|uniref:hypothetical protein n=1 Tax=Dactylosporangium sp. NPDC051485 TaxID=3154846 RepID=UPI0034226570